MKNIILVLLAFFTFSLSYSQKLKIDEIDDFDGTKKK